MKKSFFVLLLVTSLGSLTTEAQLTLPKTGKANIGEPADAICRALKPTSFLDSWTGGGKTDWLSAASKVTDGSGFGQEHFFPGWFY